MISNMFATLYRVIRPRWAQITNKQGSGDGATLDIVEFGTGGYVGRLIFTKYSEGPPWCNWQFADNSRQEELGTSIFDDGLKWAREFFPAG